MMQNFKINSEEIDKIDLINQKEKDFRIKNLEVFNSKGFPSNKEEEWKFSDVKKIFNNNFKKIEVKSKLSKINTISPIKDFDHNYILLVNGKLKQSEFKFEDKEKINIRNYHSENFSDQTSSNSLVCLNNALADGGFFLEIKDNYKFKKVLIIYNLFTEDLKNIILNNKNNIVLGKNSELHMIDYSINQSKNKFINNTYENFHLNENAIFKNIVLQSNKSEGYFHKFSKNKIELNSNYSSFIFSSGLKFNKSDMQFDLEGENSDCNIRSALFLNRDDHQEIKTRINHLVPNCRSYQKIKSVIDAEGRGVYQGKIYVKDLAQKTNAYQLSKALLLSDRSEFDSKPELEIYADDVKCSHGSTSGNVDEDSLYYLMTRGLTRDEATKLLIKGFLNDVIEFIKSPSIKKFIENKLEENINGY